MTDHQVATFMEERKWDYRRQTRLSSEPSFSLITFHTVFGFAAALLEGLPIVGLIFSISNRIGAAMWAHGMSQITLLGSPSPMTCHKDLEKRQHYVAAEREHKQTRGKHSLESSYIFVDESKVD